MNCLILIPDIAITGMILYWIYIYIAHICADRKRTYVRQNYRHIEKYMIKYNQSKS